MSDSFCLVHILQLTCPIPQDQLELLRLLSSHGSQVFSYRSSGSEVEFVGANGEAPVEQVSTEKVRHSSCSYSHDIDFVSGAELYRVFRFVHPTTYSNDSGSITIGIKVISRSCSYLSG